VVPSAHENAPRLRKKMIVALARKLLIALWHFVLIALWHFVSDGVVPEGVVLRPAQ
jgi:transposase